jgi:phosphatidylglycerophosphate synthase
VLTGTALIAYNRRVLPHSQIRQRCLKPNLTEKPWYAKHVTYAVSTRLVWLIQSTPLTPNIVSTLSLITGLAAAACALDPSPARVLAAALLLELYYALDCVDGQLSRLRGQSSMSGAFYDTVITYIVQSALLAALGLGLAAQLGDPVWIWTGAAAAVATTWISLIWHFRASLFVYAILKSGGVRVRRAASTQPTSTASQQPAGTVRPSGPKVIFSWLKKSLTFPLTMNLLTGIGFLSVAAAMLGQPDLYSILTRAYLAYTAFTACLVATALTTHWIWTRRVDRDFASLFDPL